MSSGREFTDWNHWRAVIHSIVIFCFYLTLKYFLKHFFTFKLDIFLPLLFLFKFHSDSFLLVLYFTHKINLHLFLLPFRIPLSFDPHTITSIIIYYYSYFTRLIKSNVLFYYYYRQNKNRMESVQLRVRRQFTLTISIDWRFVLDCWTATKWPRWLHWPQLFGHPDFA